MIELQRRVLPSRIRRGRMETSPVWDVTDGVNRWRFRTRKGAQQFIDSVPEDWRRRSREADDAMAKRCRGYRVPS